jgi:eukaryotic-like serine/threonine-protein kinase
VIAGGTSSSYEVLARLATGGMAEVFLAKVTSEAAIERYVVLKRVLPELAVDEQFVTMFLDEARLAAQLRHPNIAQLYDVGRMGSSYFYTMEYIHGATAWLVMERAAALGTPVPIAHVLTIAGSVAAALHHAHTRVGPDRKPLGIVHRDVTPANIMVSGEGAVKLLDFGVAKAQGRRQVTKIGQVKGKIAYLSPEQCAQTGAIDGRSDIFSLGVVLYEMLTLHQLFQRNNDLGTMTAIVHEQVPPPSYLRPDVPPELDGIVMNALAKDPANRFASADALHQTIEETAARLGISTSITALARYMTSLFGEPPEPWLALEPAPTAGHVTVVSAPLPPLDATVPAHRMTIPEMAARDSADLDERIKQMRDVRPSAPEFDVPTEIEMPPLRPSLPMAAQHPGWEDQTVSLGQAYPVDPIDRTAPEPKTSFDDDPSGVAMISAPRPVMLSAPYQVIPPSGAMPPLPTPAPLYIKPDEDKEWNVKRLVLAALLLLGIVALVLVLVLR